MKKRFTKLTNLAIAMVIAVAITSCYTIGRVVAPTEVAGNEAFDGRIKVVNDGNNATQTGLSFFAVRVPENWNVTVDDKSYKQFAAPGTVNDEGDPVNMERAMRYCNHLSNSLNSTNPKEGYTWFAFQTTECIRRNIQGSAAQGADSICFDYKVINDGVAGTYVLDCMIGSWELQPEQADTLDAEAISYADMAGSDIYRVGTENTNIPDRNFNTIVENMRRTVTVLEGGTPTNNAPVINATVNGTTVDVEYKNLVGNIEVFKNAATVGCPGLDYKVEGVQRFNNGTYSINIAGLEPGVYHLHSTSTGADGTFTVAYPEFAAEGTPLFVIGSPSVMAPEVLVSDGRAFQAACAGDAALYEKSPAIIKAMTDSIIAAKPAAVLITGDLTMNGEKVSHDLFLSLMKPVTEAGIKVLVVPGDKDINNVSAVIYDGETTTPTATITPDEFTSLYASFGYSDAVSRDANSLSYISYINNKVAVLALDACQYNNPTVTVDEEGNETVEQNASGELSQATLDWAAEAVKAAQATGRQVVAMMHHLVAAPFNGYATLGNIANNREAIDLLGAILGGGKNDGDSDSEGTSEGDIDAYGVQDAFANMGLDVVFVGDANGTDIARVITTEGKEFYQVSTGSAVAYNCPFRLVDVTANKVDIQTRIINNLQLDGLNGMSFEEYAYYRTKTQLPLLVSTVSEENWDQIHAFLLNAFTFDYDPEVDMFDKNMFFQLPETAEEGAAIVNNNIIPPLVDVILTFVDGNEDMKKSEQLIAGMHNGIDNAISAINTFPSIINPMVKEGFATAGLDLDGMVDAIVGSIAYNYVGVPSNVTNDLFCEIPFVNSTADGINGVTVSTNDSNSIYNLAGQRLSSPTKGVNIINHRKVVIK